MRALKLNLSEKEKEVINARFYTNKTYREIAEEMGFSCYQQVQNIYNTALKKLRAWRWMEKNDKGLLYTAYQLGWSEKKLFRLYYLLKRYHIRKKYKTMTREELLLLDGFGPVYVDFLLQARNFIYNSPIVKDQVDEPF